MNSNIKIVLILIILGVINLVLYINLTPFNSFDSANYALALKDYNLEQVRPHMWGYYLYVKYVHIFLFFSNDIESSLLLSSIFFYLCSGFIFFKIFEEKFGFYKSLLLMLFILTNPFIWYYGTTGENYIGDFLFSTLLLYFSCHRKYIKILPILFALYAGFRLTTALLEMPFYIWIFTLEYRERRINLKDIVISNLIGVLILLMWLVPFFNTSNGIGNYLTLFNKLNPVPIHAQEMTLRSLLTNSAIYLYYSLYILVPFTVLVIFNRLALGIRIDLKEFKKSITESIFKKIGILNYILIFLPPFLFFLLIHNIKGYSILIAPSLLILLMGYPNKNNTFKSLSASIVGLILFFLLIPKYETNPEVYYKESNRNESFIKSSIDKLNILYYCSYSKAVDRNSKVRAINSIISESMFKKVFIDLTTGIISRYIQYYNPNQIIYSPDPFTNREFYISKGINISKGKKINEYLENCIFITNIKTYQEYFKRESLIDSRDDIVAFEINSLNKDSTINYLIIKYYSKYLID